MGIGLGSFIALLLETYSSINDGGIYPACIFTMAGLGLFAGFNMTKKLDKEQNIKITNQKLKTTVQY